MNWFQQIWDNIVTSNDSMFIEQISKLNESIQNKEEYINNLDSRIKQLEVDSKYWESKYIDTQNINPIEEYWNNKYKKSNIIYNCRSLPFSSVSIHAPVVSFLTPQDPYIIEDLINWGFMDSTEDYETLIPKIYHKIKDKYYGYKFDINTWGISEVWEFPFEMREKAKKEKWTGKWSFDCDSWSHFIGSYFLAIGFPRWKFRVVCGDTFWGAHSTMYLFSEKDMNWHHLNSTYGNNSNHNKIQDFPTHSDARSSANPKGIDKIGIYKVWFSFNDRFAWYKLQNDLPEKIELGD